MDERDLEIQRLKAKLEQVDQPRKKEELPPKKEIT